jgi:predicted small lipoprotein YifL
MSTQPTGLRLALAVAATAALLAGCGQKGALYLPPKPGTAVTSGPTAPAAPAAPAAPSQPPQAAPLEPPPESAPPPKKSDPDSDSQSPK